MTTYNMDGTPLGAENANQLIDLLTIVSNADVYASKLQTLQNTITERNKLFDKVGPAEDILRLRDETEKLHAEASKEAEDKISIAKIKAEEIVAVAEHKAKNILADARKQAKELTEKATELQNQADANFVEVKNALREAEQAKITADSMVSDYEARSTALAEAQTEVDKLKASLKATKDAIIAKHQAFIASL